MNKINGANLTEEPWVTEQFSEGFTPTKRVAVTKGGAGSGNFAHRGRPGKVGGSIPVRSGAPNKSDLIKTMKDGRWSVLRDFNYHQGISTSAVVQLENDGKAIIKPDTLTDNGMTKEETTYKILQTLGWEELGAPATTSDKIAIIVSEQPGSVVQWIDNAETAINYNNRWPVKYDVNEIDAESFVKIALLDVAIDNEDRHAGNVLIQEIDGKAVARAIDHNLAYRWADNATSTRTLFQDSLDHYRMTYGAVIGKHRMIPSYSEIDITPSMRKNSAAITQLFNTDNPTRNTLIDAYGKDWVDLAAKRIKWVDRFIQSSPNMGWTEKYLSFGAPLE